MKKTVLTILLLLAAACFLCVGVKSAGRTSFKTWQVEEIYIRSGQTLWSIGRSCCTEKDDVRDWIAAVRRLNGMESGMIYAGQTLLIYKRAI